MGLTVKKRKEIPIGAGLIRYMEKPASEADNWTAMQDLGMMKDVSIISERETVTLEDGTPLIEIRDDVIREKGQINVTLFENFPEEKLLKLGAGVIETIAKQTGVNFVETKTMTGTAFESLRGNYAETITINSVTDDATPTPNALTVDVDYKMGKKEGCHAIRRVEGGAVADGGKIIIDYDIDVRGSKRFAFGGSKQKKIYLVEHISEKPDESGNRVIHRFTNVSAPGRDEVQYLSENFAGTAAVFKVLGDESKPEGEQLYEVLYEDANIS